MPIPPKTVFNLEDRLRRTFGPMQPSMFRHLLQILQDTAQTHGLCPFCLSDPAMHYTRIKAAERHNFPPRLHGPHCPNDPNREKKKG